MFLPPYPIGLWLVDRNPFIVVADEYGCMVDNHRLPPLVLVALSLTLTCACLGNTPGHGDPNTGLISPALAATMIEEMRDDPGFVIIDVRTVDEFAAGHIPGAINIDSATLAEQIDNLDPNGTYLIYCRRGGRSAGVHSLMREAGFSEVYEIEGGISAWQAEGLPVAVG